MTPARRIALVGFGLAGRVFHAPLIHATPGLVLTHVVTASAQRTSEVHQEYPDVTVVPDVEAILSRADDIDAVVVASPNATHIPVATAALERGLGVVVDKPLAASAAEGERLVDLAASRGLLCSVFQNRRWDGDFLTVRGLIEDGSLGDVHRLESRFERWRPEVDHARWRENPDPAQGGGLLFDLGSHLVDQALCLFGPAASVYAEVSARRMGAEVDDDVFIAVQHASGPVSHLWASALAAQAGPRFRVLGARSAYVSWGLDPQEEQLRDGRRPGDTGFGEFDESSWGRLGSGEELSAVPTHPGRYSDYYQGIAAALNGDAPVPVDPRDSVAGLRILHAARESAATCRVVDLSG